MAFAHSQADEAAALKLEEEEEEEILVGEDAEARVARETKLEYMRDLRRRVLELVEREVLLPPKDDVEQRAVDDAISKHNPEGTIPDWPPAAAVANATEPAADS